MDWELKFAVIISVTALVSLALEVEKMRREVRKLLTEIRDAIRAS